MISGLAIESFKRFQHLEMGLAQLTVLTGLNGSGKSTVVQSILLAHQASRVNGDKVPLAGEPGLDLGNVSDVTNVRAASGVVAVRLRRGNRDYRWTFEPDADGDDAAYMQVTAKPRTPPAPIGRRGFELIFLSAERLGPRTSHPTDPSSPDEAGIGEDGRYVAHVLATREREEVDEGRRHVAAGSVTTLGAQVEAWMSELVGEVQFEASLVPRTSLATLHVRTPGTLGEWMLPTNTGFGISYCLPVVVAALVAAPGGLLIVDSPEAHLHPSAQSSMGRFLAQVASTGVQVMVETHSDHVLNGIRIAVGVDRVISSDKVGVVYFGEADPIPLSLSERGAIERWPDGFFDQIERDLSTLTRDTKKS